MKDLDRKWPQINENIKIVMMVGDDVKKKEFQCLLHILKYASFLINNKESDEICSL